MLATEQALDLIQLSTKIIQWSYIAASVVSLVSNPLTGCIYLTRVFKGQSFRLYYPIILLSTTIPILIGSSIYWIQYLFTPDPIICKILIYLSNVTPIFSSWVSALLSVDCSTCLFYPNKFKFLRTLKFQLAFFFIILLLSSAFVLHLVIQLIPNDFENTPMVCVYYPPNDYDTRAYFIAYFMLNAMVPFIVMITCSILMIRKLRSIKKKAKKNDSKDAKKSQRFARTILGSNLYFLASILPYCVVTTVTLVIQSFYVVIPIETYAYLCITYSISVLILLFYYSTQIAIHLLCNRLFKEKLIALFNCQKSSFPFVFKSSNNNIQ